MDSGLEGCEQRLKKWHGEKYQSVVGIEDDGMAFACLALL
jgi:hypothetical protein